MQLSETASAVSTIGVVWMYPSVLVRISRNCSKESSCEVRDARAATAPVTFQAQEVSVYFAPNVHIGFV